MKKEKEKKFQEKYKITQKRKMLAFWTNEGGVAIEKLNDKNMEHTKIENGIKKIAMSHNISKAVVVVIGHDNSLDIDTLCRKINNLDFKLGHSVFMGKIQNIGLRDTTNHILQNIFNERHQQTKLVLTCDDVNDEYSFEIKQEKSIQWKLQKKKQKKLKQNHVKSTKKQNFYGKNVNQRVQSNSYFRSKTGHR